MLYLESRQKRVCFQALSAISALDAFHYVQACGPLLTWRMLVEIRGCRCPAQRTVVRRGQGRRSPRAVPWLHMYSTVITVLVPGAWPVGRSYFSAAAPATGGVRKFAGLKKYQPRPTLSLKMGTPAFWGPWLVLPLYIQTSNQINHCPLSWGEQPKFGLQYLRTVEIKRTLYPAVARERERDTRAVRLCALLGAKRKEANEKQNRQSAIRPLTIPINSSATTTATIFPQVSPNNFVTLKTP